MKNLANHPVWDVYDEYRTARLNVKYHAGLLRRQKSINFWLELTLAVSAPTSAVAGLWFWQTDVGAMLWRIFAVIAAFVAIVKPLLGVSGKITNIEETLAGYKSLHHDLQNLTIRIKQEQRFDPVMRQRFYDLLDRKKELVTGSKVETENVRLKRDCERQVILELPVDAFFIPEDNNNGQ